MSSRVASYRAMSHHVMLYHPVSRCGTSLGVMLCFVSPCRVASCCVLSRRASCRVILVKTAAAALPTNAPLRFTQLNLTPHMPTPLVFKLTVSYITLSHHSLSHDSSHALAHCFPPPAAALSFHRSTHVFQLNVTCGVIRSYYLCPLPMPFFKLFWRPYQTAAPKAVCPVGYPGP